ncbi:MAG: bifunctional 4-hydroxy-2-oxoglutarate aldolase/2-dehydro-3-deoxy-phosphogluconate aldolase [Neptuniibacter sp.]
MNMTKQLPQSKTTQVDELCALSPVVPVLTFQTTEEALPVAEALLKGGVSVLEVTLRTPVSLDAIHMLAEKLPEAMIGAGTITEPGLYKAAEEAGARFIVSPGLTTELLETGIDSTIPLLPGIQTISEMMEGLRHGYQRFKFFPASIAGGADALKAYAGPFGDIKFCPTGGINLDNAEDYLSLKNVMCVGGSWLTPQSLIENKDWKAIEHLAEETIARLKR